jgi:hypothetical protein
MVNGQDQGKAETDKGEGDKNRGVKIGLGYPTDNAQGQKKNIDGTDTVQDSKEEKDLRHKGLLFPKL